MHRLSAEPVKVSVIETLEDRKLLSTVVGISGRDVLVYFDSATPNQTIAKTKVKGLARGESLVGLDFRPANGQLYALGDTSRLYRIDPTNGRATAVGAGGAAFLPALSGTEFGFDFNPSADRIRVVSDTDVNLRLDPDTGAVVDFDAGVADTQTDLPLTFVTGDVNAGANPTVVAAAYTNSVAGGTPTTLYGIDADRDALVAIGSVDGVTDSPNNGNVTTIGALGVNATEVTGFDIETVGSTNNAFATLATGTRGRSGFYSVNLTSGAATLVGEVRAVNAPIRGIAVVPSGSRIVIVNPANRLYTIDAAIPNLKSSPVRISGLGKKEKIISIDQRPADGALLGLSNQNRLYSINVSTGAAQAVGSRNTVTLNKKAKLDMDFNPSVDLIRVVNTAGENVRYNPIDGQIVDSDVVTAGVQFDGPIVYASTDVNAAATPSVTGIAYGSNVAATPSTTLFAIDAKQDVLVTVGTAGGATSPNTGQLFTVGALGVNVKDVSLFDIVTNNSADTGYAIFRQSSGGRALYRIDLTTGAATVIGNLPNGVVPVGMALSFPVAV